MSHEAVCLTFMPVKITGRVPQVPVFGTWVLGSPLLLPRFLIADR